MFRRLVALSGGMDSTTLLARALLDDVVGVAHRSHAEIDTRVEVHAVGFDYGSKHNYYEINSAEHVAQYYGIKYGVIDLKPLMANWRSALLQSGPAVPEGHYQEENMRQTVVPGRNLIFLSILAGLAESEGFNEVWIGAHAGDHFIYPDCRPEFLNAAGDAIWHSSNAKVRLQRPFWKDDKTSIIKWGLPNGVPYHLTRTCYKKQSIACGKCGSCQERLEAFAANGIADPIDYESRLIIPKNG